MRIKLGTAIVLDDKYEIRVVVTNINDTDADPYGDIYTDFTELKQQHPQDDFLFGFVIVESTTGLIPDNYSLEDIYETLEEAIADYNEQIATPDARIE